MSSVFYQPHNSKGNYNYNIFIYEPCEYAYHFHKNFELVYILDGELEVQVDGKQALMKKDQFLLVLPNSIHYYHTPQYSKVWVGVFSEDFISEFSKIIHGKERSELIFNCTEVELAYLKSALLADDQLSDILALKASLYIICNRYLKTDQWGERISFDADLAHQIIDYVEENFLRNITLADVAQAFGYEYHYFSRCFSNIFHMNFKTFLNQFRFDYAKRLIMDSNLDMTTIAMESGFGSLRNFNRIYNKFAKNTPKSQRAEAKRSMIPEEELFSCGNIK
jgi:AraC-like DNA-binding protein